ncbi:NAD-glutamate dehydrogenase [Balneatrix alpica]|uniref:NAD-glutamate dehydrogenase n=1 Tax=Balneatrix alpica TaxID=75684 RepID=A0ABV5Z729_9GAMM|nr:NAD-glutamate dehydrogenase [Balneatrix alpica]
MPHTLAETKSKILERLDQAIQAQMPGEHAELVGRFARYALLNAPLEDLAQRRQEDLYGAMLYGWHYLQQRQPGEIKVRVYNPNYEQQGWQSGHTLVEVLCEDRAFIVDSLRMAINRYGMTIHTLQNAILPVERDEKGRLQQLHAKHAGAGNFESYVVMEVDRHSDADKLRSLQTDIEQVLQQVFAVVDSYDPICERLQTVLAELKEGQVPEGVDRTEQKEVRDFIQWLLNNHCTFLGFESYRVKPSKEGVTLEAEGESLGVFNLWDDGCRGQLLAAEPTKGHALLAMAKSPRKAEVHRPAYPDYLIIRRFDAKGRWVGIWRILGLFTSSAYASSVRQVPLLRHKYKEIMKRSGFYEGGYNWKELTQILEVYPRDEFFHTEVDELYATVMSILQIQERRRIRVFIRHDVPGRFYSCLVFAPREIYSTSFRLAVQHILEEELEAGETEFNTFFSESVLARTQYVLRYDSPRPGQRPDVKAIQSRIIEVARSWDDHLQQELVEHLGEEKGLEAISRYNQAFSAAYKEDFNARTALVDIEYMDAVTAAKPVSLRFYRAIEAAEHTFKFKLYHFGTPLPLSDILPILDNFGLRVIDEHPYEVVRQDGSIWIHDFNLILKTPVEVDLKEVRELFQDAFMAVWTGAADSDEFNRLVLQAQLNWRDVAVLRAYAAYMKQIGFSLSQMAITQALSQYVPVTRLLVQLFRARFKPSRADSWEVDGPAFTKVLLESLEQVQSLNDDRILRMYKTLIQATLRTNVFQPDGEGAYKPYLSFKFSPEHVDEIPLPRPKYEIFVYSPRVEGVHLRGGKVARGGLRWSDRFEDYRTEVLGLVKAQQVKNAVIVPVGAKGGFVCKKQSPTASRDEILAEGISCYQTFIRGLLDITDNLLQGEVVPPQGVVRHDEDDPYLVVAADKGTATFSDIANAIAAEYGFWLGDAFASGGSQGYDHKKMGITARGAWVSVQRHFREMGLNPDTTDFTVVGIGDMAGDVFGNGLLMSKHARLVAAFNHQHIFVDPNPDAAQSYQERKRLFDLPRSSWTDYDSKLISAGGGVFSRSVKSIPISEPMKQRFGISASQLTPNDLIKAILRAPVDLLWNGGIGTYIKASDELHTEVGDKANDGLRVNAKELRLKVIGEGGNLGLTQRGRIEFSRAGGRLNTDFIDNAGGVDCSDHEVNVKILLNRVVAAGDLTEKQRNQLLVEMTEDVARLVLQNNYRQTQALSMVQSQAVKYHEEIRRLMENFESDGKLNRQLEFLPTEEELRERRDEGLSRPELAILMAYVKADLKAELINSSVGDDPYVAKIIATAFPPRIEQGFAQAMLDHPLRREIIATQLANDMVNHMGITYLQRLQQSTGMLGDVIARSYLAAKAIFDLDTLWRDIERLDYQVPADVQLRMMNESGRLVRRASRWMIRHVRLDQSVQEAVQRFAEPTQAIANALSRYLYGEASREFSDLRTRFIKAGVPEKLADRVAASDLLYTSLSLIDVATETGRSLAQVAEVYYTLVDMLDLYWVGQQINQLHVGNYWQAQARESFRDDLDELMQRLTSGVIQGTELKGDGREAVQDWAKQQGVLIKRWRKLLTEMRAMPQHEYPLFTVAIRELADLARQSF